MTRWGAYRGKGGPDRHGLRPEFCVTCQQERPFRRGRCVVCHRKVPQVSKMGNVPSRDVVTGVRYQSTGEHVRHEELLWLERNGLIRQLLHQPDSYDLVVNNVHVTTYRPDFTYEELQGAGWQSVVEDWKGAETERFKLCARLMLAIHGIAIRKTGPGRDRPRTWRPERRSA